MNKWVTEVDGKKPTYKLLWKGSRDGFAVATFHARCDGLKPTLTIVHSNDGYVFGGYTSLPWNYVSGTYAQDLTAFIYSITQKYKCSEQKNSSSICCNGGYGPIFGNGHNLYIYDNSNANNSSYSNVSSYTYISPTGASYLTGSHNFTVKEIEVYLVTKQ